MSVLLHASLVTKETCARVYRLLQRPVTLLIDTIYSNRISEHLPLEEMFPSW